jgi:hypothetical protein
MTTGEFSFVLRQGKMNFLAHPIRTVGALGNTFGAMRSERVARAIDERMKSDPLFEQSQRDKLHISHENDPLIRQEELLMSRWAGSIPIVKQFNRAARTFLNKIRFDTYKAMVRSSGESSPDGRAQIAAFANESTGRGSLGKVGESAAVLLGRGMFAPKHLMSRIELAVGHSMWGGTWRSRRVIASEYARSLIGLGIYYTTLSLLLKQGDDEVSIEGDPRSSDFGKIRIGDTRLDPLAGLSQVIVYGARTATGETKTVRGEVRPIRGSKLPYRADDWWDVTGRFARSKLHPIPATISNLFSGTDLGGEETTIMGEAGKLSAPITYVDIYQALKAHGLTTATSLSLLAFLGEGLQTHKPKFKSAF